MKKVLVLCCLLLGLPVAAQAANDKISPDSFICAELVTMPMTDGGQPPIFEALQIDGYVSAGMGDTVAHPDILAPLLTGVYTYCQSHPCLLCTSAPWAFPSLPCASRSPAP